MSSLVLTPAPVSQAGDANFESLLSSGLLALENGQLEPAAQLLEQAVHLRPRNAQVHDALGQVFFSLQRFGFALMHFERAACLHPDFAQAHSHLAYTWTRLGDSARALAAAQRAFELGDDGAIVWYLDMLCHSRRHAELLEACDSVIALRHSCEDAHIFKAFAHLALLEFAPGWQEFEWRWERKYRERNYREGKSVAADRPAWQGDKSDRRLLIWHAHGLGDQVMYASLLPWLATFPQKKLVMIGRRLIPVFERSFPGLEFMASDTPLAPELFDEQLLLGSLPRLFLSSVEAFNRRSFPYLKAEPRRRERLRDGLARQGRLVCGLSWFSTNPQFGANKSLTLTQLAPVLRVAGVDFVELQYGETREQREELKGKHGIELIKVAEVDNFADIDGLVALVDACDVVVTTSSVTAHIAGALGKATLLLAPYVSAVSWTLQQTPGVSLWYPSVRVFEQDSAADWGAAIESVRQVLEAWSGGRD